ncbi:hypothetical protein [Thermophagus sp. OGC60D27]|uniref:hypothetical protein n=1 Tax=Thermophagus sp. OGC60D27 TaxID=3458415 RepID=UPI0040377F01
MLGKVIPDVGKGYTGYRYNKNLRQPLSIHTDRGCQYPRKGLQIFLKAASETLESRF